MSLNLSLWLNYVNSFSTNYQPLAIYMLNSQVVINSWMQIDCRWARASRRKAIVIFSVYYVTNNCAEEVCNVCVCTKKIYTYIKEEDKPIILIYMYSNMYSISKEKMTTISPQSELILSTDVHQSCIVYTHIHMYIYLTVNVVNFVFWIRESGGERVGETKIHWGAAVTDTRTQ